jgi:hypothetical protein
MTDDLLRPDNHDLYTHVRMMAVARDPVMSWEEIAERVGVDSVPELLAWFLSYRLPPGPRTHVLPDGMALPRDPHERAEYMRLRRREESLLTVVNEAPKQLATVQMRMTSLEQTKRAAPGHKYETRRRADA